MKENELSKVIIGSAMEVHKELGPGLLESVYEECFCRELMLRGLTHVRQVQVPILYKGVRLDCGHRIDVIVEDSVIVEIKSVDKLNPVHKKQLLTYLRLLDKRPGLLINFNIDYLKSGIARVANGLNEQDAV
ncbi:MAG: GxxExxY protein [bacterium]